MPSTLLTKPPPNLWPPHWHNDPHSIKCIVENCPFTTIHHARQSSHKKTPQPDPHSQWNDLQDHCAAQTDASHALLLKILWQNTCVIDNCTHPPFPGDPASRSRKLFAHEKTAHDSTHLSTIPSFVKLARDARFEGHFGKEAQDYAFDRLVEKILLMPEEVRRQLFVRSGRRRTPHTAVWVLEVILAAGSERKRGGVPYSVPPALFLWAARPDGDADEGADEEWGVVWRKLRADYEDGVI